MKSRLTALAILIFCASVCTSIPRVLAKKKDAANSAGANEEKRAAHALNRLAFGPRPEDLQRVMAMGVDRWIDQQLHPEKISDTIIEARLAGFRTLRMSTKEIAEEFPDNQIIRQIMDGKRAMPSDPAKRAVVQVQIARLQEKRERKQATPEPAAPPAPSAADNAKTAEELAAAASRDGESAAAATGNSMNMPTASNNSQPDEAQANSKNDAPEDTEARLREERLYTDLKITQLADLQPEQRYKKVLAMSGDEQVALADLLRGSAAEEFVAGMDPKQKDIILALNNPQGVVMRELMQAKLLRAIYSERQLQEVMTDFWFNHFNVFIGKGLDRLLITSYEQNVIRPHAMGKFEDLLVATAKSPAMLFYLDNWLSVGPGSAQAMGIPARPVRGYGRRPQRQNPNGKRKQNSGLNENYGRELLELHTLSVNGGYSQRDVTEVAKVFTGWTIEKPNEGLGFRYEPRMHEPGPKFVLGHRIKEQGEDEGRQVLHLLATSPQTAHFISLKLAQRFVADDPPVSLVDRMAKTFSKKRGDIREVLSTMFHSPEFWAETSYRAKVKTPLEFVASAVRATGATVEDAMPLARQIANMGMPLYSAQAPTGYSMKAETWVSSAALLNRMNFALALTSGKVRGVKIDAVQLAGGAQVTADSSGALSELEVKLLDGDVSKQTHESIVAQAQTQQQGKKQAPRPPDASAIAGLLLGSPEFQRR